MREKADLRTRTSDRLKSVGATILIHALLGYVLFVGLTTDIPRYVTEKLTLINLASKKPPPPPKRPPVTKAETKPTKLTEPPPSFSPENFHPDPPIAVRDWMDMTPFERILSMAATNKWVVGSIEADRKRMVQWKATVPQGSGPGKVARAQPANLATHTVYWAADSSAKLPIIAWGGDDSDGKCFNNSLPFAGFLGEIASHGYFIVAVGNDDIDPPPDGKDILPDGRSLRTQPGALTKGIDWAIAENNRPGSPYQGKLDTSKIAYMGHGCGGGQALDAASSDTRTTTTVLLNSGARFKPGASDSFRGSIAHFEGLQDDNGVLGGGDATFARAQAMGVPMFKAALPGLGQEAYTWPNKRWTKGVLTWLDWQLKGDGEAATIFRQCGGACAMWRDGWNRIDATNLWPS